MPAVSLALPHETDLARRALLAAGFTPGAPAHVPALAVEIDRKCCRAMRCARCNRCCQHEPYRRAGEYRALAVCAACGWCEEV
jgi:hypothetical protein